MLWMHVPAYIQAVLPALMLLSNAQVRFQLRPKARLAARASLVFCRSRTPASSLGIKLAFKLQQLSRTCLDIPSARTLCLSSLRQVLYDERIKTAEARD